MPSSRVKTSTLIAAIGGALLCGICVQLSDQLNPFSAKLVERVNANRVECELQCLARKHLNQFYDDAMNEFDRRNADGEETHDQKQQFLEDLIKRYKSIDKKWTDEVRISLVLHKMLQRRKLAATLISDANKRLDEYRPFTDKTIKSIEDLLVTRDLVDSCIVAHEAWASETARSMETLRQLLVDQNLNEEDIAKTCIIFHEEAFKHIHRPDVDAAEQKKYRAIRAQVNLLIEHWGNWNFGDSNTVAFHNTEAALEFNKLIEQISKLNRVIDLVTDSNQ